MRLFEEPASVMNFQNEKKNYFFIYIKQIPGSYKIYRHYCKLTSFLNHLFRLHFSASAQFNKCYETLKKSI